MRKSFVTICSDSLISLAVDACLDKVSEDRRVDAHLRSARSFANSTADNFWSNSAKAEKLTVLQDRVTQASTLAESSCAALAIVHQVMFPLNDQPVGLSALLSRFENGEAIYQFVRKHLRCGALVALSFVRAHYPEVDMELLKGLPQTPSGRFDMENHYAACRDTADCIARQIMTESDRQRASQGVVA
jgi:hypothetical protein